ncbi:MAG: MFS transporter [Tannerellaceae bacterium]|jgi:FSR family fosmidomycin resistance protein-like MFS transporter|nr:MFS transporter [Tannerellaceae bacterium]
MRKQTTYTSLDKATFRILAALGAAHFMNDALQSVVSAAYPIIKEDLSVSYWEIGLITLVYQAAASVFQPVTGLYFDRRPSPRSLHAGMLFTMTGMLSIAFADTVYAVFMSVFMIGIGSSVFHPEASRLTFLASGGRRGLAQSLFQVGGNAGGAMGPLMVALLIAPYGRRYMACFAALALLTIMALRPVSRWYAAQLLCAREGDGKAKGDGRVHTVSRRRTVFTIAVLLLLILSKYIYTAGLTNFYTFFLIEKFGVTARSSQLLLFVFVLSTAIGTLIGGPLGDRIGRKYVIRLSILGAAPFALLMPHVGLLWTVILSFFAGLIISSAFPAILVYAQELLPYRIGLVSGLFFGFAFGVAGVASALFGFMADIYGVAAVYGVCSFMPLAGIIACLLPDIKSAGRN